MKNPGLSRRSLLLATGAAACLTALDFALPEVAFAATGVESDLYFIKTRNTGSGKVEVHSYPRSSAYQGGGIHTATALGTGDQWTVPGLVDTGEVCGSR